MAVLWLGGVEGYGMATKYLSSSGTSFGFAFLISSTVLVSNLLGLFSGEWNDTSPRTRRLLNSAVVAVVLAMMVLAVGGMF
jgi:hypothetical protein